MPEPAAKPAQPTQGPTLAGELLGSQRQQTRLLKGLCGLVLAYVRYRICALPAHYKHLEQQAAHMDRLLGHMPAPTATQPTAPTGPTTPTGPPFA